MPTCVLTATAGCPYGIDTVTLNLYALGSVGTLPGGSPATTLLGTAMGVSMTGLYTVTNATGVDIASAFNGLGGTFENIIVDQALLPEDVNVCIQVDTPCGNSGEVCDTAWACAVCPGLNSQGFPLPDDDLAVSPESDQVIASVGDPFPYVGAPNGWGYVVYLQAGEVANDAYPTQPGTFNSQPPKCGTRMVVTDPNEVEPSWDIIRYPSVSLEAGRCYEVNISLMNAFSIGVGPGVLPDVSVYIGPYEVIRSGGLPVDETWYDFTNCSFCPELTGDYDVAVWLPYQSVAIEGGNNFLIDCFSIEEYDVSPYYCDPLNLCTTGLGQDIIEVDANDPASNGGGATFFDLTANNNDLALVNGAAFTTRGPSAALGVTTVNDMAWRNHSTSMESTEVTVEAWVYFDQFANGPDAFAQGWNIIASKWFVFGGANSSNNEWHFAVRDEVSPYTAPRLNLFTTSSSNLYGNTVFRTGRWYHVAFTIANDGTLNFYVNGRLDGTYSGVSKSIDPTAVLKLADNRNGFLGMNGGIGYFRMHNTALCPMEVYQSFDSQRATYVPVVCQDFQTLYSEDFTSYPDGTITAGNFVGTNMVAAAGEGVRSASYLFTNNSVQRDVTFTYDISSITCDQTVEVTTEGGINQPGIGNWDDPVTFPSGGDVANVDWRVDGGPWNNIQNYVGIGSSEDLFFNNVQEPPNIQHTDSFTISPGGSTLEIRFSAGLLENTNEGFWIHDISFLVAT